MDIVDSNFSHEQVKSHYVTKEAQSLVTNVESNNVGIICIKRICGGVSIDTQD